MHGGPGHFLPGMPPPPRAFPLELSGAPLHIFIHQVVCSDRWSEGQTRWVKVTSSQEVEILRKCTPLH